MSKLDQWFKTFVSGSTVLERIFEPMPADWQKRFHVGDRVKLIRPFWDVPPGAEGVIKAIDPENYKGRVLNVEFDMSPYNLTFKDMMRAPLPDWAAPYTDEPLRTMSSDVTPMDIIVIEPTAKDRLQLHVAIADLTAPTLVALDGPPGDVLHRAYTYWTTALEVSGLPLVIHVWCPDVYLDERARAELETPICRFGQSLVEHVEAEVIRQAKLMGGER